ncbi:MAG: ParB N-terminal domain-containing protein [Ruminococcaceae bacterium]|nr:ParB N-terminal domain-containing protein [Oscillospiraceae bacterium]
MKMLRKLRKDKKLSMKELGSIIGVAESTISLYESGKREPDYKTLLTLAQFFNVSTDYLLQNKVPQMPYLDEIPISFLCSSKYLVVNTLTDDKKDFKDLEDSIKKEGVLVPIIVRPMNYGNFLIIDGERRVTACINLKIEKIKCIIINVTDEEESCRLSIEINKQQRYSTVFDWFRFPQIKSGDDE